MHPRPLVRLARTAAAVAALGAVLPASASAADCPAQPTTKPFAPFGDVRDYFLAPGGDFEGAPPWVLHDGATVHGADKPLDVLGDRVLDLEEDAAATSPAFCMDALMPHLRFGARASDDDDRLRVVAVDAETGEATTLATLSGATFDETWRVTPEVPLAAPLGLVAGAPRSVRLRLVATRGHWLADGVLVDPLVKR